MGEWRCQHEEEQALKLEEDWDRVSDFTIRRWLMPEEQFPWNGEARAWLSLKERGSMGWGLEITSVNSSFEKGHQWAFLNPCFHLPLDIIVLWLPLSGNVFSHGIYIMSSDAISMFPLLVEYIKDLEDWTVVMPHTLGHRKIGRRAFQREGTRAKA